MKHLAIIVARKGSQGLPGKNIRPIHGHPLMAWSINAAIKSDLYSNIILSTDSEEYAEIGRQYGAEVPYLRNAKLADHDTPASEVIIDIINNFKQQGIRYEYFSLLQPTSPLRNSNDLKKAWEIMNKKNGKAIVAVTPCDHPPQWAGVLPENHSMEKFLQPQYNVPRQKLQQHYRANGAIYISETDVYIQTASFIHKNTYAYVMPRERSIDIDDEVDFMLADVLMQKLNYKL